MMVLWLTGDGKTISKSTNEVMGMKCEGRGENLKDERRQKEIGKKIFKKDTQSHPYPGFDYI
jgi:hypothetical protein